MTTVHQGTITVQMSRLKYGQLEGTLSWPCLNNRLSKQD